MTVYTPCGIIVLADLESGKESVYTMPAQVKSDDEFDICSFTTPATQKRLSIPAVINPDLHDSVKHIALALDQDLWSGFDVNHC